MARLIVRRMDQNYERMLGRLAPKASEAYNAALACDRDCLFCLTLALESSWQREHPDEGPDRLPFPDESRMAFRFPCWAGRGLPGFGIVCPNPFLSQESRGEKSDRKPRRRSEEQVRRICWTGSLPRWSYALVSPFKVAPLGHHPDSGRQTVALTVFQTLDKVIEAGGSKLAAKDIVGSTRGAAKPLDDLCFSGHLEKTAGKSPKYSITPKGREEWEQQAPEDRRREVVQREEERQRKAVLEFLALV